MKKSTINYPYSITTTDTDISYLYNAQDLRIFKHVETPSNTIAEYYLRNSSGQELGIFTATANNDTSWTWYVQGAERLAKIIPQANQQPNAIATSYNNNQTFYVRDNDTLHHTEYYLTDHLGNTRITYLGKANNGTVSREIHYMADYYPFGKVLREYVAGDEERFQFISEEKDQETQYNFLNARMYDGDLGRMLGVDMMLSAAPHWTPYRYGFNNPISFIDPSGMFEDNYSVDSDGNIKLEESTDDNFDMIYTKSEWDGKKSQKNGLKIYNQSILKNLSNVKDITYDYNGNLKARRYATVESNSQNDIYKLFTFVANNTNVEWSTIRASQAGKEVFGIATYQHTNMAPGSASKFNLSVDKITTMLHSHPNVGDNFDDEEASLYGDRGVQYSLIEKNGGRLPYNFYVYMVNSGRLWSIDREYASPQFIRNIGTDYRKLFFGTLNSK